MKQLFDFAGFCQNSIQPYQNNGNMLLVHKNKRKKGACEGEESWMGLQLHVFIFDDLL